MVNGSDQMRSGYSGPERRKLLRLREELARNGNKVSIQMARMLEPDRLADMERSLEPEDAQWLKTYGASWIDILRYKHLKGLCGSLAVQAALNNMKKAEKLPEHIMESPIGNYLWDSSALAKILKKAGITKTADFIMRTEQELVNGHILSKDVYDATRAGLLRYGIRTIDNPPETQG